MAKTLILFRHADKTPDGKHISAKGREQANEAGLMMTAPVDHIFYGPLIRTTETAIAMMTNNPAFADAVIHDPVDGLGSNELFATLATDEFRSLVKDGFTNYGAVMLSDKDMLRPIFVNMRKVLEHMFEQMDEGELGVGVFHDPTIPMAALAVGMVNARSLESMEAIVFSLHKDGVIRATWE